MKGEVALEKQLRGLQLGTALCCPDPSLPSSLRGTGFTARCCSREDLAPSVPAGLGALSALAKLLDCRNSPQGPLCAGFSFYFSLPSKKWKSHCGGSERCRLQRGDGEVEGSGLEDKDLKASYLQEEEEEGSTQAGHHP